MRLKIFISAYSRYIYNTGSTHDHKHNKFRCSLSSNMSPIQNKKHSLVCFLLGNFPGCEIYVPTFRNSLFHLHRPMKMEQTECSETSAYKIQTPGNYPEESVQRSEHGESLKSRISLIAHALVDFSVFLTVIFIITTNSHQSICIQIMFKTIFNITLLIFIIYCCNSIVMIFICRRIPQ